MYDDDFHYDGVAMIKQDLDDILEMDWVMEIDHDLKLKTLCYLALNPNQFNRVSNRDKLLVSLASIIFCFYPNALKQDKVSL